VTGERWKRPIVAVRLIGALCALQGIFAAVILILAPTVAEPLWKRGVLLAAMLIFALTSFLTGFALWKRSPSALQWFTIWAGEWVIVCGFLPYLFAAWRTERWVTLLSGVIAMSLAVYFLGRYLRDRLADLRA
jgi:hypothetical protein